MAFLASALPYITAGVQVASSIGQANAASQIADIEARQLEQQANADLAAGVQEAKYERRRAEQLASRATALAAKSGTYGPDIDRAIADINEQGEYNALAALYSGNTASSSKRYAATAARASGASGKTSGYARAGSTILSAMEKKYG